MSDTHPYEREVRFSVSIKNATVQTIAGRSTNYLHLKLKWRNKFSKLLKKLSIQANLRKQGQASGSESM